MWRHRFGGGFGPLVRQNNEWMNEWILHHIETHVPLGTYTLQQITPLSRHTSLLPHYMAQSDCLAADRQGQDDTRLTLTPSIIPNSNYVIMVGDWNYLKYCIFACFLYCNCQVHRDFLITWYVLFWYADKLHIGRCRFDFKLHYVTLYYIKIITLHYITLK